MNSTRLNQLKQFIQDDPDDPFNWYALALEYLSENPDKSLELFDKLIRENPSYLPTYYHAGKLYIEMNNQDKAIELFEKGIEIAKAQKNFKTQNELRSALDELLFD